MPQKTDSSVPMNLVPTVCGAVKFLQGQNNMSGRLPKNLKDTNDLKREGLEMAKEAMRRVLSRRVLEMTSTGNFRLKAVTDSLTANDLAEQLYSNAGKRQSKPKSIACDKKAKNMRLRKLAKKHVSKSKKLRSLPSSITSTECFHRLVQDTIRQHKERIRKSSITKSGKKTLLEKKDQFSNINSKGNKGIKLQPRQVTKPRNLKRLEREPSQEEVPSISVAKEMTPPLKKRLRNQDGSTAK